MQVVLYISPAYLQFLQTSKPYIDKRTLHCLELHSYQCLRQKQIEKEEITHFSFSLATFCHEAPNMPRCLISTSVTGCFK